MDRQNNTVHGEAGNNNEASQIVLFGDMMGVRVNKNDPMFAKNSAFQAFRDTLEEEDVSETDVDITVPIFHENFAYLMHGLYSACPDDYKVVAEFDGIVTYERDEEGQKQSYNAQLLTLKQIPA